MTTEQFNRAFAKLTKHAPLSWQVRFYESWRDSGEPPSSCDLPTGMGKTMLMAIWLAVRSENQATPRRLVYVVDRRTVVDQATDLAEAIAANAAEAGIEAPAISTLRGHHADNREWTRDLSRTAIVIGTVDLIGSGLLFSGYRSGFKRRPLEAGLLGEDALLILDEAHLSRPFDKLLESIHSFQRGFPEMAAPLQLVRMSAAALVPDGGDAFRLKESDLTPTPGPNGEETNQVTLRYEAPKTLSLQEAENELPKALADAALQIARNQGAEGKRIVIFARSPRDATAVAKKLQAGLGQQSKDREGIELLTGTMRGLERDRLVAKPVFTQRWLNGDLAPSAPENADPVFLVSTSAGEVGFDLNADHLVGDAAPLDSWIQRLGRVNRRGLGNAKVVLVRKKVRDPDKAGRKQGKASPIEKSTANTTTLLAAAAGAGNSLDASPKNLERLRREDWKDGLADACSPEPAAPELTDILLDAWSLTTVTEPMPGRPPVGPWLRGLPQGLPETAFAWRAELNLQEFGDLSTDLIEDWFDFHRILPQEVLTERSDHAAKWLADRWQALGPKRQTELGALPVIIDRSGIEIHELQSVAELAASSKATPDQFQFAQIILPADFGGIAKNGLLDATPKVDDAAQADVADEPLGSDSQKPPRHRQIIAATEGDDLQHRDLLSRLPDAWRRPDRCARFALSLPTDDGALKLVSYVPDTDRLSWGNQQQSLECHVEAVRRQMRTIIERLRMNPDSTIARAAHLAAEFHDHGKNRQHWQRLAGGVPTDPGRPWAKETLGKAKYLKRDPRRYRHEFGSVRELCDAAENASPEALDLALHMIAAHHGRARPHFPAGGFDPGHEAKSTEIRGEITRRFARLQRKYGWWRLAWLESLLRCADALASAAADPTTQAAGAGRPQ
jgi:CRISPR-associated endonuclease/helicase Cas3